MISNNKRLNQILLQSLQNSLQVTTLVPKQFSISVLKKSYFNFCDQSTIFKIGRKTVVSLKKSLFCSKKLFLRRENNTRFKQKKKKNICYLKQNNKKHYF